jgi:hypothetical protein
MIGSPGLQRSASTTAVRPATPRVPFRRRHPLAGEHAGRKRCRRPPALAFRDHLLVTRRGTAHHQPLQQVQGPPGSRRGRAVSGEGGPDRGGILPRAPELVEGEVGGEPDAGAAEEVGACDFRSVRVEDPQLVEELAEAGWSSAAPAPTPSRNSCWRGCLLWGCSRCCGSS